MAFKPLLTFVASLALFVAKLPAQNITIDWKKTLGGSDFETTRNIQRTTDGGYIITGVTFSTDGHITANKGVCDGWLVKLDAASNIEWQRTYGGDNDDGLYSVHQTSDGGYIMAGYTKSNNNGDVNGFKGQTDCWIVKTNAGGNIQWQKVLGGSGSEVAGAIRQTEGGYIFAAYTVSTDGDITQHRDVLGRQDYWLVKLDTTGDKIWDKCFGGPHHDFPTALTIASDGGYVITGYTQESGLDVVSHKGNRDIWVIKTSNTGTLQWQQTIGGSGHDIPEAIITTTDGGYIIAGNSTSASDDIPNNKGATDAILLKLDNAGNTQWINNYGGTSLDAFRGVLQTSDGGFIVIGSAESNNGDVTGHIGLADYWVVKTNAAGAISWQRNFGGTGIDDAFTINNAGNNSFILAGSSFSNDNDVNGTIGAGDIWTLKIYVEPLVPQIITQPADTIVVCKSDAVNFTIVASNANSYQWQGFINNVWQPLPAGTDYSGVTTPQLTIINAGNTNIERFRCIVSNAHGNATSSTGLVTTNSPALITTQPAPVNTCTNTPFVLNAKVNSSLAVQYQWQQLQTISWTNIAGATEASVTSVTGNTETEHSYRVIAENSCGADTSSVAKVSVINCNIPNAFSPNDDGVNDVWRMSFPSQYRVHIFSRNGMNVYKGNHQGVFSWRGLANGKALPDGVYYYHVTAPGYKTLSGSLTLLR